MSSRTVARDRYVHRRVTRPDGKPSAACVRHTRAIAEVVHGLVITSYTRRVTCKLPGCSGPIVHVQRTSEVP